MAKVNVIVILAAVSVLAKNTLFLTGASVLQKAVAFVYYTFIAQTIGDEAIGAYFLALALTTTIGVLDDIGLTPVLIRETAKDNGRAPEILPKILGFKLLTIPFTVAAAFLLPPILGFAPDAQVLVHLAVIVMLLDTFSVTFYGVLRGLKNLRFESLGMFVGQILTATFGVICLTFGIGDLRLLIVALILGSAWNAVYPATLLLRRFGWRVLMPKFVRDLHLPKIGFAFFLAAVFVKISSYADSFILNMSLGRAAVGDYSAAYKLTYAFQFLPMAFVGALYPTLSSEAHDLAKARRTLLFSLRYTALLAFSISFGVFALAPEIIGKFYGSDFAEAIPTLRILIFVLPFIFLDFPIGSFLNAADRQNTKTAIVGGVTVLNIVANLIFIPLLGLRGPAIAALISFGFMFVAGFVATSRVVHLKVGETAKAIAPSFVAGLAMMAAVLFAKGIVPWLLTIPFGALVFAATLLVCGGVTKEEGKNLLKGVRPSVREV